MRARCVNVCAPVYMWRACVLICSACQCRFLVSFYLDDSFEQKWPACPNTPRMTR